MHWCKDNKFSDILPACDVICNSIQGMLASKRVALHKQYLHTLNAMTSNITLHENSGCFVSIPMHVVQPSLPPQGSSAEWAAPTLLR